MYVFIILLHKYAAVRKSFTFFFANCSKCTSKLRNLACYFSILKIFQSDINNTIYIIDVLILPLLLILLLFYCMISSLVMDQETSFF